MGNPWRETLISSLAERDHPIAYRRSVAPPDARPTAQCYNVSQRVTARKTPYVSNFPTSDETYEHARYMARRTTKRLMRQQTTPLG